MKTSELEGVELDYWVAKAVGHDEAEIIQGVVVIGTATGNAMQFIGKGYTYSPSADWSMCGPLIEMFGVEIERVWDNAREDKQIWWVARLSYLGLQEEYKNTHSSEWPDAYGEGFEGKTPQEAICRAVVASVYGEEVSDD